MAFENAPVVTAANQNANWEKAASFLNFEFVAPDGSVHKMGALRLLMSEDLGKKLHMTFSQDPTKVEEMMKRVRVTWRSGERQHKEIDLGF